MRLIIIGGVAAGTKAASRAKRVAPEAEVTLYQEEPDVSISECGMPYFLSGVVGERERLVARTPEQFSENGVEVKVRHRVESIDAENKKLLVRDLGSDETFEDSYDRLIVATGARAILPPIPGSGLGGVFTLRFLTDADVIDEYINERSPRKAIVVGGGYIGLEMAESLATRGMEVSLIEAGERLVPTYGPEVARIVDAHLEEKGVKVFAGDPVEGLACEGGPGGEVRVVEFGEEKLEADLVVVGIGVRPEVELAKEAGAEIGESGAIKTDRRMRTNLPDVWAAGDCAETVNLVTGEPAWVPLGDTANQMGRVAGTNAAGSVGEGALEFPGVLGTGIFKVFDLGVGKTGLSESEAKEAGFETLCASVEASNRAGYFPDSTEVFFKLISDKASGRILGAEVVGASADKLVDVSATAIWSELSHHDLVNMDLAYAPPFGPTLSPVIQAATVLSRKFEKG